MNRTIIVSVVAAAMFIGCTAPKSERVEAVTSATTVSSENGQKPLEVGVYADRGPSGIGAVEWFRLIDESPEMNLRLLDGKMIREGALQGLDLLVMPGGSSEKEYLSLQPEGVEKLKDYIRNGGNYLGTCAGCCLLMDGPKNRARMMPWNSKGAEGSLMYPNIALNPAGAAALGMKTGNYKVRYHGGPFLWPTTNSIPESKLQVWGTFNAEASFKGAVNRKKQMYGAVAIVGGEWGKGRIFVTSCHPEYFQSTLPFVSGAIKYLTGRTVTFPMRKRAPRALSVGIYSRSIRSVECARTMVDFTHQDDMDVVLIDNDGIFMRRLDNIDVLVIPCDISKEKQLERKVKQLIANGVKVVGCGMAQGTMPVGSVECEYCEAVQTVRKLFN